MTTVTDIANRALQACGTRVTVTDAELAANNTNEAININLVIENIRDDLSRMAPWNFTQKTANLVYITSQPGTPENVSPAPSLWAPGQPAPPWAYEYQYPADCLRMLSLIPATQTGFAAGIPITTAVTGGAASFWQGPPVKFKVANDQFFPVTAAAVAIGGINYAVGDIVTLPIGPNTSPPIGAPAQLLVTAVNLGSGAITAVSIIGVLDNGTPTIGGSYFRPQSSPIAQASTTGLGTGATFSLTFGTSVISQKVILTNQEFATATYIQRLTDPNIMDTMFQSAWTNVLAGTLCQALTGDKKLANFLIGLANQTIEKARTPDGNEGLTINDVTPDWIRTRGIDIATPYSSPFTSYDWGGLYPIFG